MHALSGGERARVFLASLIASGKNLLILDEPTNHLDIPSAERLEEALSPKSGYEGALILISHDRALIDAACDRLLVLDGEGECEVFLGNYTDWRRKQQERERAAQEAQQAQKQAEEKRRKEEAARKERARAEQAKKRPPSNNALARLRTEQLEERIEKIETRIGAIDRDLADPAVWQDAKRSKQLGEERTRLAAELEPLEFEWSRRAEEE
jgi:ATPase subunit of ABC transporter with duplicated ATPase domains